MLADRSLRLTALGLLGALACTPLPEPPPGPVEPPMEPLVTVLEAAQHRLPVAFAVAIAPRLVLLEHSSPTLALAFFVPLPPTEEREASTSLLSDSTAVTEEGNPSPLIPEGAEFPSQAEGLLFVNSAAYAEKPDKRLGGRWKSLSALPVDTVEYLFHALLRAHLELRIFPEGGPYVQGLEERAAARMPGVPEAQQLAAYSEALASFGAHTLAVANEMDRVAERQEARGVDICQSLHRRGTLFALWPRIFTDGQYTGRYDQPPPDGQEGEWTEARLLLDAEDKALFLHHIFKDWWGEDPGTALERRYCGAPAQQR